MADVNWRLFSVVSALGCLAGCGGSGSGPTVSNPGSATSDPASSNSGLRYTASRPLRALKLVASSGGAFIGMIRPGATPHAVYLPPTGSSLYVDLTPKGATTSSCSGVSGSTIVGSVDNQATVWTSPSASSAINITPPTYIEGTASAIEGNTIVGSAYSDDYMADAFVWTTPSANSGIRLTPLDVYQTAAAGISGDLIVGYAHVYYPSVNISRAGVPTLTHACAWTGVLQSQYAFVDLNPSGYSYSVATAVDNGVIVGNAIPNSGGSTHAMAWTSPSSKSAVDLNPPGFLYSTAVAVKGGWILGTGVTNDLVGHTLIWTKPNVSSYVVLNLPAPRECKDATPINMDENHRLIGNTYRRNVLCGAWWTPTN